jgi:hypothetical protein
MGLRPAKLHEKWWGRRFRLPTLDSSPRLAGGSACPTWFFDSVPGFAPRDKLPVRRFPPKRLSTPHDLQALAALIPLEQGFPVRVEDLAGLNPYAVNVRYADDWREPQLNDAKQALALAPKVRAAVRELMPPPVVD